MQLKAEIASRSNLVYELQATNKALTEQLAKNECKIDELDQYSRRDNLLITGLFPSFAEMANATQHGDQHCESSDTMVRKVIDFCNDHLELALVPEDISVAHFIKSKRAGGPSQAVVRFIRRSVREAVYRARFKLKDLNTQRPDDKCFYINEDLSDNNRKLLVAAHSKIKIDQLTSVYTSNGRVKVKDIVGNTHNVSSVMQLNDIIRTAVRI